MKWPVVTSVAALIVCIGGCGKTNPSNVTASSLVGTWSQEDVYMASGGTVTRYNPDGTFVSHLQGGPVNVRLKGNWRVDGDELVETVTDHSSNYLVDKQPRTHRYKLRWVSKDVVERSSDQEVQHYRRRA